MTEPKKVKRTDSKRESVARCGTAEAESLPPRQGVRFERGDMPEIGHSSSSRGVNAGSRGRRLRCRIR